MIAQPQDAVVQDGLMEQRQPGGGLTVHPAGDAHTLSQPRHLAARFRPEHGLHLRGGGARRLALLVRAEAQDEVASEQELDRLLRRERDRRQVVAGHHAIALTGHGTPAWQSASMSR